MTPGGAEGPLHVERIGDELLLTVHDEHGSSVVSLPIPDGVQELITALRQETGL
jgi:hypothetical protein